MEPLTIPAVTNRGSLPHWRFGLVFGLLLALGGGCAHLGTVLHLSEKPPVGAPCHAAMAWNGEIVYSPDTTRNGRPTPGFAGRFYLFGADIKYPMASPGSLVIDLYDEGPEGADREPLHLEQWHIDPGTLERLLQKDAVGWGYTLFLPWGTYRPDINRVQLRVRYEPLHGAPLYADPASLVVNRGNAISVQSTVRASRP